jgi:tetratricopeptide (TPR) repeat protein
MAAMLATSARPSLAQDGRSALTEAQRQKAKEHYEKATRLYNLAKYVEAIEEYQQVYLVSADPRMLFNIAQSYRLADQPAEAVRFYRNYLRNAPAVPRPEDPKREDIEKRIADLEKVAEERRKSQPALTPPGPVSPLPPPVTTTPPPVTPPPPPVTTPGAVGAATPTAPTPSPEVPREPRSRWLPYTLLVGGGVFLATAAIAGGAAASKAREVEKLNASKGTWNPDLEKSGKAASAVAVVTGLVGLAAGVTGAVLLWTSGDEEPEAAAGAQARSIYPIVGPGFAGAGARVSF